MKFEITNVSEEPIEITLIDQPTGMFKIDLPDKIKAGSTSKGEIDLDKDFWGEEFQKSITIELSDPDKTRFTIPVKRVLRTPSKPKTSSIDKH